MRTPAMETVQPLRRKRWRPTVIWLMATGAIVAVWLGSMVNSARMQRLAVAEIRRPRLMEDGSRHGGGSVRYKPEVDAALATGKDPLDVSTNAKRHRIRESLNRALGQDFVDEVSAARVWFPTEAKLAAVASLRSLRFLEFKTLQNPLRDDDLAKLRSLQRLQTLRIWGAELSDAGMAQLTALRQLEKLDLTFGKIDERGLRHLQRLPHLKTLIVGQSTIGGTGLLQLGSLSQVERLFFDGCSLEDDDLAGLAGMAQLRELHLPSTPIGDASLVHLHRLRSLTFVDLRGTRVTKRGVEKLKDAIPGLQVRYP